MKDTTDLVIANTLRIAREDLQGAKDIRKTGNRNAVYLLEQAAEKIIRAVLTSEDLHGGIGHQLDGFVGRIPDENPLKDKLKEVAF